MKGRIIAASTFVFCVVSLAGERPLIVTPEGIGAVKIGMTIPEAEKALGHKLTTNYEASGSEACGNAWTADTERQGFGFMVEDRILTRIDVEIPKKGSGFRTIVTAEGIGVGSTEAEVRKAYGNRLKVEAHPYLEDQGHYLIVDDPDHRRGIIFETDLKRVTSFRTGSYPAVGYIEGCA